MYYSIKKLQNLTIANCAKGCYHHNRTYVRQKGGDTYMDSMEMMLHIIKPALLMTVNLIQIPWKLMLLIILACQRS